MSHTPSTNFLAFGYRALNYGAVGWVIGHEMTHSFDVTGRKYDGAGVLNNWWKPGALKIHKAKKQCIEEIYSVYPTPELKDQKAWKLDAAGTVAENMADIGGLQIVLSAYKKYLQRHGPEKKLPGLTQYSPEQLFFIGNVQIRCETSTKDDVVYTIMNDEHTPAKYGVVVTVSNSKEFSEAWKCKEGDRMNPKKKCQFW